jgi:hypothetical protein
LDRRESGTFTKVRRKKKKKNKNVTTGKLTSGIMSSISEQEENSTGMIFPRLPLPCLL